MKIKELLVMICQKKKNVLKLTNEELNQGNGDYDSYELSDEE